MNRSGMDHSELYDDLSQWRHKVAEIEQKEIERGTLWQQLSAITDCFSGLGADPIENIKRLTQLCGQLMDASCAFYHRVEDGTLSSWVHQNAHPDCSPGNHPEDHICLDVIKESGDETAVFRNVRDSDYETCDPNPIHRGLRTYVGRQVLLDDTAVGALCLVYQGEFVPTGSHEAIMKAIVSAVGVEEKRRQGEERHKDSMRRYDRLVENLPNPIFTLDADGIIRSWNRSCEEISGFPSDEAVGKNFHELILRGKRARSLEEILTPLVSGSEAVAMDMDFHCKNGRVRRVMSRAFASWGSDGTVRECTLVSTDITDLRHEEQVLRDSEEKYRQLVQNAGEAIFVLQDGVAKFANRMCETLMGLSEEELTSQPFLNFVHPDDRQLAIQRHELRLQGDPVENRYPIRVIDKHGTARWVEVIAVRLTWEGRPAVLVMGSDISERRRDEAALKKALDELESRVEQRSVELTRANERLVTEVAERRKAEEALRQSEDKYRLLAELLPGHVFEVDENGYFTFSNHAGSASLGYELEELVHCKNMIDILPADAHATAQAHFRRLKKGETITGEEYTLSRKDGSTFPVVSFIAPITFEDRFAGARGIAVDISELKRMQKALSEGKDELENRVQQRTAELATANEQLKREIVERSRVDEALCKSEEKHRTIIENMQDGYFETDLAGNMVFFNDATCRLLGYSRDELTGMNNREYTDKANAKAVFKAFNRVYRTGETTELLGWQIRRKDGSYRILETPVSLIRDAAGEPSGFRGWSRDVTEKKRADADLKESEAKYRTIIENIEEGYYEVDLAGNMVFCNDALCRILGYSREKLIGMNNRDYMDAFNAKRVYVTFNSVYKTGNPVTVPGWELLRKDGTTRSIETSVSIIKDQEDEPIGFRGIVRDVTDRAKAQMQLAQGQKLEAIGTLAGGIAHDFNNILYAIIGYTELALDDVPHESVVRSNLEAVLNSGNRARDLVNQILTFSRQGQQERKLLNIGPIIKEGLKFLRASLPTTIDINYTIEQNLKPVIADATQIHQILMNLCTNAGHAMREKGGAVQVSLAEVEFQPSLGERDPEISPGSYLKLTVSDTGTGMHPHVLHRIFEPYFTTKQKGEGTGLGLAVVHGIVKSYGGAITVESEFGQGSEFHVYLPAVQGMESSKRPEGEPVVGGHEHILFVDDESMVVEMTAQMLRRLGYQVTTRTASIEALHLFRARPNDFDLVITDMTMPGMTGIQLTREMRKTREDIPVILCTGFSELITEERINSIGINDVIPKPILKNQLATAIRRSLNPRGQVSS